ncbi:hypothetical protein Sp245p_22870 (plasmid) [Azospirillum baldaniorum]|uniref:Uncharacterized protein n=1 Tax=Azospirillum baldaniorum TaxID=1064539 RepID=A0A9P1JZG7_9PROT|nr:hypothetical protein Sp245p_22870 [Azospirillum baldaniorum]CCD02783.1 protein of unknown function [Azospirillum baldaniorum]
MDGDVYGSHFWLCCLCIKLSAIVAVLVCKEIQLFTYMREKPLCSLREKKRDHINVNIAFGLSTPYPKGVVRLDDLPSIIFPRYKYHSGPLRKFSERGEFRDWEKAAGGDCRCWKLRFILRARCKLLCRCSR